MTMTHVQYALSKLAEANAEASAAATVCQQFGLDYVIPNDPMHRTAGDMLYACLRRVTAATHFVENKAGPNFELVPDTQSASHGMDKMRIEMGYAIESGTVEPYMDEEEDE